MARNAKASVKRQRKLISIRKQRKANELRNQVQDTLKWLIDERIFAGISLHGTPGKELRSRKECQEPQKKTSYKHEKTD